MFSWLEEAWSRLRGTWRRDALSREMDAEFRFHIERATERNIERGMAPADARTAALRDFGGVSRHKESANDEQRQRWLEDVGGDVRYGLRTLASHPRFTVASVLTVAIAIAANTAVFSVVNGVLLRPLPFPESSQLVYLGWSYGERPVTSLSFLGLTFARQHSTAVEGIATYRNFERPIGDRDAFEMARGLSVSIDFFRVTRIAPALGRPFDEAETAPGGANVAILSDDFWRARFGGRYEVLGSSLELDGRRYAIVGVMPPDFRMPEEGAVDVLLPLQVAVKPGDDGLNYVALTRLKDGVTREQLTSDLETLSRRIIAEHPQIAPGGKIGSVNQAAHFAALEFSDVLVGNTQRTLWILLAAVVFVALIACANVANLLLVRAAGREREIAVRAALGAGRARIVRQLLIESLLLSAIAGLLGLGGGMLALRGLLALAPNILPRVGEIQFDGRVALFTAALSIVTGMIFGTISAWAGTHANLLNSLGRGNSRGATNAGRRVREMLIAAETAIAIVLLAGSGLLITSFARLRAVDPGFDMKNVVTARFTRLPSAYRAEDAQARLEERLLSELRAIPGVEHATVVANFPLQRGTNFPIAIEGRPDDGEGAAEWRLVSDGYFGTFRIPVIHGRDFSSADNAGTPRVVIINTAMAEHYWPGENPIGKRIEIGKWQGKWVGSGFGPAEIIGVAGDIREVNLAMKPRRTFYTPRAQWAGALQPPRLALRTAGNVRLESLIETATRRVDPRVKPPVIESMRSIADASVLDRRFETMLLSLFAGTALLLTAIGIYGVIASAVSAQQREIGIRMALGAQADGVVRAIVGRGMIMVGGGALVGLVAAFASTRVLTAKLYGVSASDPMTMMTALGVLVAVAMFAAWLPARRAARVQPADALRAD